MKGRDVSTGATGPMLLGSLSVPAFAMILSGLVIGANLQPFVAAIVAWPISIGGVSLPAAIFLRWRAHVSTGVIGVPASVSQAPDFSRSDDGTRNQEDSELRALCDSANMTLQASAGQDSDDDLDEDVESVVQLISATQPRPLAVSSAASASP